MPGGNVNITCVAVGSPMPYVKWMQGAEDLTPEDDMPVGRNVLELTDVKDSANYTCVAMSSLGVIEAVAQITVKCEPGLWCGWRGLAGKLQRRWCFAQIFIGYMVIYCRMMGTLPKKCIIKWFCHCMNVIVLT